MNIDPVVAASKLNALLSKIPNLKGKTAATPEFGAWESDVRITLTKLYGEKSEEYSRFKNIWFTPGMYYNGQPESELVEALDRGLEEARLFLNSRKEDWDVATSLKRWATFDGHSIENRAFPVYRGSRTTK